MPYKVFLVEDEIVTREGIRDNIPWAALGFEFCGEAPDGEIALPLIQESRPDLVITDIKMPFMDGLDLSRILRERMPRLKIVILSGHDEFEYAQKAIQLGVAEYLLKPVTVQDLSNVLTKIAGEFDREHIEMENLRRLRNQMEENRTTLTERLLFNLIMGAVSSAQAIDQGNQLGINLIAGSYLAMVIKIELCDPSEQNHLQAYQRIQSAIADTLRGHAGVFLLQKGPEEVVLILLGNGSQVLERKRDEIVTRIHAVAQPATCRLVVGGGTPKSRLTDLCQSFIEALANTQSRSARHMDASGVIDKAELLKINKSAIEHYLKCGVREDFDGFFDTFIRPLGDMAFKSYTIRNYVFMDIVLITAHFINELGFSIDQVIPDIGSIEKTLARVDTVEQIHEQARNILVAALALRDSRANNQYARILQQAREYIAQHYMDAEISLNEVASQVNLSPFHFSAVFSNEIGQTFKDYLTAVRLQHARELLRSTSLRSFEIAEKIGYNDAHYFSYVFRKHTGMTPKEYRQQARKE